MQFDTFTYLVVAIVFLVGYIFYLFPGSRTSPSVIPGVDPSSKKEGNLSDIADAGSLHEFLQDLHADHGPVASFWLGNQFVVSLAHPDAFRAFMGCFDRPAALFQNWMPLVGPKSIQFANGEVGRQLRAQLDGIFSHESCEHYLATFTSVIDHFAENWENLQASNELIPLRENMLAAALKAVTVTCFGEYFNDDQQLFRFAKNYDICHVLLDNTLTEPFPPPDDPRAKQFVSARNAMKLDFQNIVAQRRRSENSGDVEGRLLIDQLIDFADGDEDLIVDTGLTYVIGGFHTTGNLMTWMLYFLATHPDVQERVFEEIQAVLGKDEELFPAAINDLVYTKQVIDETLRLAAIGPYAARVSNVDLSVSDYTVPKETPVIFALGVVFQSADFWRDPEMFDPDRFSPEKLKSVDSLTHAFFGFAGRRKCPGFRFSYTEAFAFLAVLIRKFVFTLADADQVVVPLYGLVSRPNDEIYLRVKQRESK